MGRFREIIRPWGDIWIRSGWRVQLHCASNRARLLDPTGKVVMRALAADCIARAVQLAPPARARKAALLMHGVWGHTGQMRPLALALEAQGWAMANFSYASLRLPLAAHALAAGLVAKALAEDGAEDVSFIGHSLGGLVARAGMAEARRQGVTPGKLILIGSPAYGSSVAKIFCDVPGYNLLIGACGPVVTPAGATEVALPVVKDVLVIAGGTGKRGYNPLLRGDNDGLITVAETRMKEHESGFRLIRAIHKTLPAAPEAVSASIEFLRTGTV